MKTAKVYEQVVSRLLEKVRQSDLVEDGGEALGRYLAERIALGKITWATAKQYASAVRWQLRRDRLSTDPFDTSWQAARPLSANAKRSRPSNRRSRISSETVATLRELAAVRDGNGHRIAVALFHATVLFGLRPCEWASATWGNDERTILVVANAKTASRVMDHGPFAGRLWVRGNGTTRRLILSPEGIASGAQSLVDEVIRNEARMPWQKHRSSLYRSFRDLVKEARRRDALPRRLEHLTIYSARHQFAADAKKTMNLMGGEVAAAMGHSSARTAITGYGKRMRGGAFSPAAWPDQQSVAAVRNVAVRTGKQAANRAPAPGLNGPR